MELMVYCGLIGIIVMVAGQAYSDSVKFRIRSESMVKSSSVANAAATILQEDLSQMGAKASIETGSIFHLESRTYMDFEGGDTASYVLTENHGGSDLDRISFKRLQYSDSGRADFVQQISWYVADKKLYRQCETLDTISGKRAPADCGMSDSPTPPVLIASDSVTKFTLRPGRRVQDASSCTLIDLANGCFPKSAAFTLANSDRSDMWQLILNREGSTHKISGFFKDHHSQLYLLNGLVDTPDWTQCSAFTFQPNVTYAVSLRLLAPTDAKVNFMRNFQAESDHIGVGFRTNSGQPIPGLDDFLMYPAQLDDEEEGYRYFEFSVPEEVNNACLTFTFAMYSSHVDAGYVVLSDLSVFQRNDSSYDFDDPGTDRRQHKAFKMNFSVNHRGEVTNIERIIPTPNNGI